MKKYLLFLFLISTVTLKAQNMVSGKVIDEKTNEVLAGISVYVNSSTIGTVTDAEGKFALSLPFSGKIELVISHLAYQKKMVLVETGRREILLITLKQANRTLNEVVIKSSRNKDDNYNKWGLLFNKILMGKDSHFAYHCEIKNPDVLAFYFDKETNELEVFAKSPLVIENRSLAYTITLDLENFKYAFNTDVLKINYSTFFEELTIEKSKRPFIKNRRYAAYYGSQLHFMRSVYANDLTREGFSLYAYKTIKNKEKDRVRQLIQQKIAKQYSEKSNPNYDIRSLFTQRDTISHYLTVMQQNDMVAFDTTKVSLRKLAALDREMSIVKFNFKDTLMINYKPSTRAIENISGKEAAEVEKSHGVEGNKNINTFMYFVEEGGINIQSNGYFAELSLFVYGNMSERRISQLLPWDYEPVKTSL